MKASMILGAIVGFLIGAGFRLAGGRPWLAVLWHAFAVGLVAAQLTRCWSRVWLTSLSDAPHDCHPGRASASAEAKTAMKL